MIPGITQSGDLWRRSHSQKAKQPLISPKAATMYHTNDLIAPSPAGPKNNWPPQQDPGIRIQSGVFHRGSLHERANHIAQGASRGGRLVQAPPASAGRASLKL
jgi:hypothetical protein